MFYDYWKYEYEVLEARKDPTIIHYTNSKPWVEGCTHPWKEEFLNYKRESIWSHIPMFPYEPRPNLSKRIKKSVRKLLERIGLLTPFPTNPPIYIE